MSHDLRNITIRNTTLDDMLPLRIMHAKSWLDTYPNKEYHVSRKWVEERTASWFTPEGVAKGTERSKKIYGKPEHLHQIALDGGKIVGIVHASRHESTQHLGALYVDKAYYGTGLAQQLMDHVVAWLEPSLPTDLQVAVYNERAKAFYRKYGFEEIPGTEERYAEVIPVVTMERKRDIPKTKGETE